MLSKNGTISSTNWENQHYFETLSALTLKIRTSFNHCSKFECWERLRYLCSKYHVKFEVNTDHDYKSRWHFGARLANSAKRACTLLLIYYLTVISCNTFGVATSPNVADLSTSFNGMNLNMWSLGIDTICFFFSILCFSLCCFFAQIMLKNMLFALHYAKFF